MKPVTLRRLLPLASCGVFLLLAAPAAAQRHGGGGGGGSFHAGGRAAFSGAARGFSGSTFSSGFRASASPQMHAAAPSRFQPAPSASFRSSPVSASRYVANPAPRYAPTRPATAPAIGNSFARPTASITNRYTPSPVATRGASSIAAAPLATRSALPAQSTLRSASSFVPRGSTFLTGSTAAATGRVGFATHGSFRTGTNSWSHCAAHHHAFFSFRFGIGCGFGFPFLFPATCWYVPSFFWWGWPYYWTPYYCPTAYWGPETWWWPADVYQPRYYRYVYSEQPPSPVVVETRVPPPDEVAKQQIAQGHAEFQAGKYDEAAKAYDAARKAMPGDATIDLLLADAVFATGDYHQAAYLIGGALRRQPELAHVPKDVRSRYRDGKEFDAQIGKLQQYLVEHPYDAMAQLALGYNLSLAGRTEESRQALRRLLEIDPDNASAKTLLAEPPPAVGGPVKKEKV